MLKTQRGAERIVAALESGKVRCVFGLPGTQTIELFEALRRSRVRTVVATNELSAAFMAGGWARISGDPGLLLTIPGPGFTWALTGVAEAKLDSIPVLHIAGAPANAPRDKHFRQQELDQAAIASSLVKAVVDADTYADPAMAVHGALMLCRSGEPGPVLLHVSPASLVRDYSAVPLPISSRSTVRSDALEIVSARMRGALRPILMVGQGTIKYAEDVRALVEQMGMPLLTTPSARGVLPEDHPLNFGFDPLAGNVADVNEFIQASDLIVAIGCKLAHSGTSGFALDLPSDRLIHIDASAEVVGANYPPSIGVVSDAGDALRTLLASGRRGSTWADTEIASWRARLAVRQKNLREPRIGGTSSGDARSFFAGLRRALPPDAVVVLDSGLHQTLARRHFTVLAPCGLLAPTGLQSMGFAIPTAIGARLADPKRATVAITGDGGFAMTALELLTAVREGLSLLVIVFVDGAFGQIRMQQLANYGVSHGVSLKNPDFALLAEAIGARHVLVRDGELESDVAAALAYSGVTVLQVPVGDTVDILRSAVVSRAREMSRNAVGTRGLRLIKKLLRPR